MRPIKFRAWVRYTTDHRWDWAYKKKEEKVAHHTERGEMSLVEDEETSWLNGFIDLWDRSHKPEDQFSYKEYMANLDEVSISLRGNLTTLIRLDVLEIMQFTGLLDKNGKEIYEGDIVNDPDYKPDRIVFYEPLGAGFYTKFPSGNFIERLSLSYQSSKVIGNIYENPELLE